MGKNDHGVGIQTTSSLCLNRLSDTHDCVCPLGNRTLIGRRLENVPIIALVCGHRTILKNVKTPQILTNEWQSPQRGEPQRQIPRSGNPHQGLAPQGAAS
ncbi:MAG: hypothetical protein KME46_18055 [Brasilonema angustatum HA4187-MV1]|jgi:hypothetical protein|nr:hypothetical protein [Brasilonema angustatum HA4187-MV1]